MNERILACRISEVTADHFTVHFFDGTEKTCYFEDLPYLETNNNLTVGEIIKVRFQGDTIIPLLSRPRNATRVAESGLTSRQNKKIKLMQSFDCTPLLERLDAQVKEELIRQTKEKEND